MSTLDEAKQALSMAKADAVTNARLVARAYPTLRELVARLADDPDAVRDITEDECLAVRAALIYAVNSTQLALLEMTVRKAIAETTRRRTLIMADVIYDFAADVTAAERAIARLEQKTEKLENANKQLHRTSKQGASGFLSDAQGMLTSLVSMTAAVGVVTQAYAKWQERVAKLRDEHERFNDKLVEGLLAQGPRIRHVLQNLLPGVTPEQGEAVFAGITSGAPELTPAQAERATRDFARLAPLFTTFDEVGEAPGGGEPRKHLQAPRTLRIAAGRETDSG